METKCMKDSCSTRTGLQGVAGQKKEENEVIVSNHITLICPNIEMHCVFFFQGTNSPGKVSESLVNLKKHIPIIRDGKCFK